MELYFSQHFDVSEDTLAEYGALDVSIVSDLPLFIDPFLLFNSEKTEYQDLHSHILEYLYFLKSKAGRSLDKGLLANWFQFKEVKQNWLGFTLLGNGGHALGPQFAAALHGSLSRILNNFGEEEITESSHLEKLCLIKAGVGRDSISDFTTNLIKDYLLRYTESFAKLHIDPKYCQDRRVTRATFNYETESWETKTYYLPILANDFVLLTPVDILTRDDTWISHTDMIKSFEHLPIALPDEQLRAQVNNYFTSKLGRKPTAKEKSEAAQKTIEEFPELIDYYIRSKEERGNQAEVVSAEKVSDTREVLVDQVKLAVTDLEQRSEFYEKPWTSYEEALSRVLEFKNYVENQDGYRVINRAGQPFSKETEVQLFFGLIWCNTDFDVNREPNNGRGPVDFKVSYGSGDKSLIEFKLGSNSSLKRNLEKQVAIYEAANGTRSSVKAIVYYTAADERRITKILRELGLAEEQSIVLIDARSDNKPSASKA